MLHCLLLPPSAPQIQMVNGQNRMMIEEERNAAAMQPFVFDDLEKLCASSTPADVEKAKTKYTEQLCLAVKSIYEEKKPEKIPQVLLRLNEMIRKAWEVSKLLR